MKLNPSCRARRSAFTLVETLVVIALMGLLVAILIPALLGARAAGVRTESMNNLNQIGEWMQLYSQDHKQFIVPSRFDYSGAPYAPKVRSNTSNVGFGPFEGTWTDILWTLYVDGAFPAAEQVAPGNHDYTLDSPDDELFRVVPEATSPFRAARENTRGPNRDVPGYFAANDFFNADPNDPNFMGWYTQAQIPHPDRSMYVVDSWVGETIADDPAAYDYNNGSGTYEVDFRYEGDALLLMLDGHVRGEAFWQDLAELESRDVKVLNLDQR